MEKLNQLKFDRLSNELTNEEYRQYAKAMSINVERKIKLRLYVAIGLFAVAIIVAVFKLLTSSGSGSLDLRFPIILCGLGIFMFVYYAKARTDWRHTFSCKDKWGIRWWLFCQDNNLASEKLMTSIETDLGQLRFGIQIMDLKEVNRLLFVAELRLNYSVEHFEIDSKTFSDQHKEITLQTDSPETLSEQLDINSSVKTTSTELEGHFPDYFDIKAEARLGSKLQTFLSPDLMSFLIDNFKDSDIIFSDNQMKLSERIGDVKANFTSSSDEFPDKDFSQRVTRVSKFLTRFGNNIQYIKKD